ncbi:unnamed protein product [Didymodactylos carnosus]|uniref:Uncharacterized protein n=1 Tax=Didymodactylos carnosus TaxID=1234261 RepID=A0A8S2I4U5_9BILA|nr:unnamed protein product [Didymodactylos carnosus]CAF3692121.1 unnamed protein product [Didymodactylos carnosus]
MAHVYVIAETNNFQPVYVCVNMRRPKGPVCALPSFSALKHLDEKPICALNNASEMSFRSQAKREKVTVSNRDLKRKQTVFTQKDKKHVQISSDYDSEHSNSQQFHPDDRFQPSLYTPNRRPVVRRIQRQRSCFEYFRECFTCFRHRDVPQLIEAENYMPFYIPDEYFDRPNYFHSHPIEWHLHDDLTLNRPLCKRHSVHRYSNIDDNELLREQKSLRQKTQAISHLNSPRDSVTSVASPDDFVPKQEYLHRRRSSVHFKDEQASNKEIVSDKSTETKQEIQGEVACRNNEDDIWTTVTIGQETTTQSGHFNRLSLENVTIVSENNDHVLDIPKIDTYDSTHLRDTCESLLPFPDEFDVKVNQHQPFNSHKMNTNFSTKNSHKSLSHIKKQFDSLSPKQKSPSPSVSNIIHDNKTRSLKKLNKIDDRQEQSQTDTLFTLPANNNSLLLSPKHQNVDDNSSSSSYLNEIKPFEEINTEGRYNYIDLAETLKSNVQRLRNTFVTIKQRENNNNNNNNTKQQTETKIISQNVYETTNFYDIFSSGTVENANNTIIMNNNILESNNRLAYAELLPIMNNSRNIENNQNSLNHYLK